jgi:hypothetical protein
MFTVLPHPQDTRRIEQTCDNQCSVEKGVDRSISFTGMGLDILHSIAAMAGPTHTIQFLCPAERASHHMAPLTPDAVEAAHARDLFGVLKQGAFARPTGAGRCIALEAVAGSPTPGGYG